MELMSARFITTLGCNVEERVSFKPRAKFKHQHLVTLQTPQCLQPCLAESSSGLTQWQGVCTLPLGHTGQHLSL